MSTPRTTRQVVLAARPTGAPTVDDFGFETIDLPEPKAGQVLVRNVVMSVDPYMRGRMNDTKSYVAPFHIGEPLDGGAVGEVIASTVESLPVGASVLHGLGWREHALLEATAVQRVDVDAAPASAYLGVLGMPGRTAYAGLLTVGEFKAGDAVFVSGAAGAVGSLVGQLAKIKGASRVIGSAGSPEKVRRLLELGFDAAFDYHAGPVAHQLRDAAPDGIDVYFDNVGGDHLEAAIGRLNVHGRVAMCGAIAQYNSTEPPCAPRNLALIIGKRLTLRGFLVSDFGHLDAEFRAEMTEWLNSGQIQYDETIRHGLDSAPEAFIDLLAGGNTGKMVVAL